jgi:hypothetical protein
VAKKHQPGFGTARLADRGRVQVLDLPLEHERIGLSVTIYVCAKCRGACTLAYQSDSGQVCRACFLDRMSKDYANEERSRVGKPTDLVTVVFPDGRIVKMSVSEQGQEIEIEDSMKDFGKLKRKFREDIPL